MSELSPSPPDDTNRDPDFAPGNPTTRRPKRKHKKSKFQTPQKRAKTATTVDTGIKREVDEVTTFKQGRQCLVTCESFPTGLVYAHVLDRRRTPDNVVTALANAWGLQALNLDTRYNIFTLRSDMHTAYDAYDWTLVPTLEELKRIKEITDPKKIKKEYSLKGANTKYKFLPLSPPALLRLSVLRGSEELHFRKPPPGQRSIGSNDKQSEAKFGPKILDGFGVHYRGLSLLAMPLLYCHIHPFLVICKAHYAFKRHPGVETWVPDQTFPEMKVLVDQIFNGWVEQYADQGGEDDVTQHEFEQGGSGGAEDGPRDSQADGYETPEEDGGKDGGIDGDDSRGSEGGGVVTDDESEEDSRESQDIGDSPSHSTTSHNLNDPSDSATSSPTVSLPPTEPEANKAISEDKLYQHNIFINAGQQDFTSSWDIGFWIEKVYKKSRKLSAGELRKNVEVPAK